MGIHKVHWALCLITSLIVNIAELQWSSVDKIYKI